MGERADTGCPKGWGTSYVDKFLTTLKRDAISTVALSFPAAMLQTQIAREAADRSIPTGASRADLRDHLFQTRFLA
jgi:hypothetical protein